MSEKTNSHNLPGAFANVVIITNEPVGTRATIANKGAQALCRRTTVHRTVDEGRRSKICQRRAGPRSSSDCVTGSMQLARFYG